MAATSLMLWLQLGALAALISFAVLWCVGRFIPSPPRAVAPWHSGDAEASYLFQDDLMFDHDAGALPTAEDGAQTWAAMRTWLDHRFADLPASLEGLIEDTPFLAAPREAGDTAVLRLTRTVHGTRVTLTDPPHAAPAERHDMRASAARMTDITDTFNAAPHPIWKTGTDGTILWRNAACEAAFDPALHPGEHTAQGDSPTSRFCVTPQGGSRPKWYELCTTEHNWGGLHYATDVSQVVSAERMQKDFVQTLTKTFAYLPTGLAVFDRNRKLVLFNPALIDLTSLGAEFLIAQPNLMAFFDSLRDRHVMPEPRSYSSWRTQIGEVIDAAEGGHYQETWSLPNDVTYRVTGRPHPDGAVAFLFDDISAEVMAERRFRAELDLRQSALDCLPEAVIVIGPNNVLAFCNTAATELLNIDPDASFADMTVPDLMRACATALPAPSVWSEVERRLRQRQPDAPLRKSAEIAPNHCLTYRAEALSGGARMLMLRSTIDAAQQIPARLVAG
ncbi:PAS-domain containing protein [Roseovarius arcticus]|uniref:PAS-domain containing protein n=1 Tax=Roseovarius arcticus TaxID=2547404 RepID=UPI001110E24A|nr:PAS-domain containing protein [Roseovarius arcticus]